MRKWFRPSGLLRRFLRHTGGNPLIQFALVAPVFFGLVFMIVDEGLAVFTEATLDNATRDASRNILIGASGYTSSGVSSTFITAVCNEMAGLIPNCSTNLQVYVDSETTFAGITPATASGATLSTTGYTIGGASSCVIVQTAYNRPYIPFIGRWVSGGSLLLMSTIAFKIEPYS
jgi:Flp pilus assembly protein TadG